MEYEGLHIICSRCSCYGHLTKDYKTKTCHKVTAEDLAIEGLNIIMLGYKNVYCNVSLSIIKISENPGGIHEDCFVVTRRRRPRDDKSVKSKKGSYGDDDDDDNNRYVALHDMEKSILIAYKRGGLNVIKATDPVIEGPIKGLIDKTVHR